MPVRGSRSPAAGRSVEERRRGSRPTTTAHGVSAAALTLYQFEISHYCEKARWALEFKGLDYRLVNLVPGPHLRTIRRLAPRSSVPVLDADGEIVQGSAAIISWLDRHYPGRPLTPTNTADASLAVEWERTADHQIGIPLRRFFYHHILPQRRLATRLLTAGGPWWGRPLYAALFPLVRARMRAAMDINAAGAAAAASGLERVFGFLEERLRDHRYLAGATFSRADLAACALLAPLWREIDDLPAPLEAFIAAHRNRAALTWARNVYDEYRNL